MFGLKRLKEIKLSRRQFIHFIIYLLFLIIASLIIHEVAHVLAALTLGVHLGELKLGFYGMNPSITLPEWFTGAQQKVVHYAGGLTSGIMILMLYLLYWVRKYRHSPIFFNWVLGLVTVVFAGMQIATGYLEGRYHAAYISGARELFSLTDILIYGWALSALFFHFALCPLRKVRKVNQ